MQEVMCFTYQNSLYVEIMQVFLQGFFKSDFHSWLINSNIFNGGSHQTILLSMCMFAYCCSLPKVLNGKLHIFRFRFFFFDSKHELNTLVWSLHLI